MSVERQGWTRETWAREALRRAVDDVASAAPGQRHKTVYGKAKDMGAYVLDGVIPRSDVESALVAAAEAAGVSGKRSKEARRVVHDGLGDAKAGGWYPSSVTGWTVNTRRTVRWRGEVIDMSTRRPVIEAVSTAELGLPTVPLTTNSVRLTWYEHVKAVQGTAGEWTWAELEEAVSEPRPMPRGGKDELPLWSAHQLEGDSRAKRPDGLHEDGTEIERECYCEAVHALVLDYDDEPAFSIKSLVAWWGGVRFVAHTSAHHLDEKRTKGGAVKPALPRGRVILALSRPVTEAEYARLGQWVLSCGRGDVGRGELANARRAFFVPTLTPDYWWYAHEGGALDVDAVLDGMGRLEQELTDAVEAERAAVSDLARLPRTDLGNAKRYAARFGDDLRWCDTRQTWLVWTGTHWEWDQRRVHHRWAQETVEGLAEEVAYLDAELKALGADVPEDRRKRLEDAVKAAREHSSKSQSSSRISAIPVQGAALPGMAVSVDELDVEDWLLTTPSGTIDLQTGQVRPPSRGDLITRRIDVPYEPGATCPTWDAFLRQVLPDADVRGLVQRFAGYALTGDNSEQRWMLATGTGSNGKSTTSDVLRRVLGGYATVLPARVLEQRRQEPHATELMTLRGARLAIGSEPRRSAAWDAERIKMITGELTMTANLMRRDPEEFRCTAKLLVTANELPRTDDIGHSFFRRLLLVPFTVTVAGGEVDPQLPAKLWAEAPGVLLWMLEGLRQWREGGLQVPSSCMVAAKGYRDEQDHVARFVEERCDATPGFSCPTDALYAAFAEWWDGEGMSAVRPSKVQFGKSLSRLGFTSSEGAKKRAIRHGIRLAEEGA